MSGHRAAQGSGATTARQADLGQTSAEGQRSKDTHVENPLAPLSVVAQSSNATRVDCCFPEKRQMGGCGSGGTRLARCEGVARATPDCFFCANASVLPRVFSLGRSVRVR